MRGKKSSKKNGQNPSKNKGKSIFGGFFKLKKQEQFPVFGKLGFCLVSKKQKCNVNLLFYRCFCFYFVQKVILVILIYFIAVSVL